VDSLRVNEISSYTRRLAGKNVVDSKGTRKKASKDEYRSRCVWLRNEDSWTFEMVE